MLAVHFRCTSVNIIVTTVVQTEVTFYLVTSVARPGLITILATSSLLCKQVSLLGLSQEYFAGFLKWQGWLSESTLVIVSDSKPLSRRFVLNSVCFPRRIQNSVSEFLWRSLSLPELEHCMLFCHRLPLSVTWYAIVHHNWCTLEQMTCHWSDTKQTAPVVCLAVNNPSADTEITAEDWISDIWVWESATPLFAAFSLSKIMIV